MDNLDFAEGIKVLSSCYHKDISNDDLIIWYEMLQGIEPKVFKKAIIRTMQRKRLYLDKTKIVKNNYYLSTLEQAKKGIISKEKLYELLEVPPEGR